MEIERPKGKRAICLRAFGLINLLAICVTERVGFALNQPKVTPDRTAPITDNKTEAGE